MIKVATFPRSGHHWLMNMVQDACKLPVGWHCDSHLAKSNGSTQVIKTHDFNLDESGVSFIQWRDPVECLCSWYELGARDGNWQSSGPHWRHWSIQHIQFAAGFYRKWVVPHLPDAQIVQYWSLCADPALYVERIAKAIGRPLIRNVRAESKEPRKRGDFEYYDEEHFELLDRIFDALT